MKKLNLKSWQNKMAKEKIEQTETPKEKAISEKSEPKAKAKDSEKSEPKEDAEVKKQLEKVIAKETFHERRTRERIESKERELLAWKPKTKLGKDVKSGKIKDIDEILDNNLKILEPEIVDLLIKVQSDLISMGQSKGKFGGGKRRAWRQTQRKTKEGNVPTFSAFAVVGDGEGHVGIGVGKSMETLPARDKAVRKAKLNLIKVIRGDGSFDSVGGGDTSIPFKIEGKMGSVRITLMPAAPGTGLVVADELKKVLKLAGIKDIYSKSSGRKRTTFNFVKACVDALNKTNLKNKK